MENLFHRATSIDTGWEQKYDECLDFLRETCRNSKRRRTSSGVVNASIARLARLEGLRNALRQRFEHVGSGHVESQKRGFLWLEIETAFNNRVLTGVVLNSSYIEPRQFLDNAGYDAHFIIKDIATEAMIAKPNFHSRSIFSEDLIAVELRKLEVKLNKPIYSYVGMCILEISKLRLYEFHYEYIIPSYRDKCKIIYTDTYSLIYLLENVYEDIKRDIARFDTSDYPERSAYDTPRVNNKIPGLMKDENGGAIMTEFIGLKAKMYALRVIGKSDTKRIKGVKKNVVAKTITFDDYARCLNDVTILSRRQSCIRSTLHEIYTVSELKLALSPYDDKRYVIPESVTTLPWGHYKISL
ncbi:hypothetical protein ALC56_06320 [Trachymyrmex septentrionalis]|uniref:Uncharacterized protein n=1 Tax=Trachymyrmex septentrionalis TaxID=34720 RepID=A0A151JX24_9HYME|nr:hypothetical protein ALC56_06320 [Trachymyrmex septentrionalis]